MAVDCFSGVTVHDPEPYGSANSSVGGDEDPVRGEMRPPREIPHRGQQAGLIVRFVLIRVLRQRGTILGPAAEGPRVVEVFLDVRDRRVRVLLPHHGDALPRRTCRTDMTRTVRQNT